MAGDPHYDIEQRGEMDYPEHVRTYELFLSLFKWGTIGVIALVLAMAVSLIGSGGILGGVATFVIALGIGYFAAK